MFRVRPAHWRVIAPFLLDMPSSCCLLSSGVGRLGEVPSDAVRSFTRLRTQPSLDRRPVSRESVPPAVTHRLSGLVSGEVREGQRPQPGPGAGGGGRGHGSSGVLRPRSLLSLHPPPSPHSFARLAPFALQKSPSASQAPRVKLKSSPLIEKLQVSAARGRPFPGPRFPTSACRVSPGELTSDNRIALKIEALYPGGGAEG